ncbi:hypothetical protein [Pontimicrobium sp. IMCC45349]|jgi:hypothetical protein|uniref:hypothetical protein n=1 Tax=Pontimicrobium sp. IMCC45349 TaxID=3391574 RepID=UPI00399F175E
MVLDNIEQLLEKYENAETTLQEEQQLKDYFSQETVAPHLEMYKPMFTYFLQTQKEQYTKDVPLKPKKTINLYRWISVAAVAVLMFGIYTQVGNSSKSIEGQLNDEQLLAYNQTVEAFNLLSSNFNKSKDNINTLGLMSTSLDKGTENIAYLGEFSNTTNKIFKNK